MALLDVISYTLSSKIAESAVSGVDSMSVDGTTLKINCVDGNLLEMDFPAPKDGKDGADGVSVVDIDMNEEHELIFIMSDGSQIAAGKIDVIKGDTGEQGLKGDKGDAGYSPIIAENTANTEDNYKLDITNETNTFTTPNLKGKPGVQGLQGVRGEKGDKGDIGLTGEKGADGVSPTVIENADNSDVTYKLDITDANGTHTTPNLIGKQGPQGLKGDKGDKGDTGSQGIAGEAGADGVSPLISSNTANTEDIYKLDITDANGTFTTPNLIGRQGPQGIQGEVGPQGEQGIQGIQGIQGEKGEDGYPFLIYREYASIDDFDPDHFPEIGLMFMIKAEEGQSSYPIYRYTGMADTPYSFVTDLATSEGLKGEKGEKGDQGEQGIQGEKGTDGITYTPVIGTVTTVDSMSDAAADIVIDSEAKTATFNFSLPKGANGAIGGKGDKGAKGDTGEKGEDGADGITYTPAIGTVTTVDSASEAAASVDVDSENARATFNFSIPRGQNGLQGIQGEQGPRGIQGEAGKDGEDGTTYIPNIGTVTTVSSIEEATANVELDNENKLATFNFNIPKGVGVKKVEFTSSTLGDVAGIASATDTYTITFTDESTTTYEVYNGKDCDVQIDDETASETSVWSSKKTSDEFATKQENIFMKHISSRKGDASDTKPYCLIATLRVSNVTFINEPIIIEGVMGNATSSTQKMLFKASFDFRNGAKETAKVIYGYINQSSLFSHIDLLATLDESAEFAYIYVHHKTNYSMIDADISIPQRNASMYLTIPETFEKTDTIIGTEVHRMSTSTEVKVLAGLDDVAKHSLPLVYTTGNYVNNTVKLFKLANVIKDYTKNDFDNLNLLLSTRRGDEIELITGSDDNSNFVQAYRRSNATTKISAMYRDGYDIYVRVELYVNFFKVYHKSGNLPSNFEVIQVDAIPDTATEVTIRPLPSIITTRSLTLKSGYNGYITEVYDPATKVVVYNVNINGTFKGLGNAIATGFKVPSTATSGADVIVSTIGIYGAINTSTGDAQFTRLLIRSYGNPFLDVDAQGNYEISGTITYVTA